MTDNELIKKNIRYIIQRMPEIQESVNNIENLGNEGKAFTDMSADNEIIAAVSHNGRNYYLNSRYEAARAAAIWAESIGDIHYKSIIILCGMSNGMYVKALLDRMGSDNIMFIYEPDISIFTQVAAHIDLKDVIQDKRVFLFVENLNMDIFREYFKAIFRYELINLSKLLVAPGYGRIYQQKLEWFNNLCLKEANFIQGEKNTLVDLGSEMIDNEIRNLWKMASSYTIDTLKKHFEESGTDVRNIPAIIVSAGPSLDGNIEELKKAEGHALIVAVDSAIRKMLAHDILPDLIITIDSHKPMILFEDDRVRDIPVVICGQTRHEICRRHRGPQYVFADDIFTIRFYGSFGKEISTLKTGGSVANNAFSLVRFLGFKNIVLVGQDLAFTDNRKHASNVYEEKAIGEDDNEKYTYVEGIDGKPIMTFTNFCIYKEWFEGEIRDNPEYNVINATEGGANIKGASNRRLKDVVDEYQHCHFDSSVLYNVRYEFDDAELESVYAELKSMYVRCDDISGKFRRGIRDYIRFKELVALGKNHTGEFHKIVEKLKDVNTMNQEEPIIELISMYSKAKEYDVLEKMYVSEADGSRNESMRAADQGIHLLEIYTEAVQKVKEMLQILIECEVSQDIYEISTYRISFIEK